MTTETLTETRPAPVEPTTPIKPSEAIRLGCLIAPIKITGSFFDGPNSACALGAMALGLGYHGPRLPLDDMPDGEDPYYLVEDVLPMLSHPDKTRLTDGVSAVYLRNDGGWSRERIADWLAEQGL